MTKIIHYCWFGENPKSKIIERCIKSWSTFFPDYELIEWNESNFDVNHNIYVKQAYEAKKWAFVSDYVRFWALEQYGGLYFDTDVEVIRPFDILLQDEAFVGFETDRFINPGLVMYAKNPHHTIINATKEYYDQAMFLDANGNRIRINVCGIFTNIISDYGFGANGQKQQCLDMVIYPKDFFCPFDDATGILTKTENTYSIHWYDKSWMPRSKIIRNKVMRIVHRVFGSDIRQKLGM